MAVIEHLPYSPRVLLQNIYNNLKPGGSLYIDVPNIYYAPKIVKFLLGTHIQPPIEKVYHSDIPFIGHHREYNVRDLKYIAIKLMHGNKFEIRIPPLLAGEARRGINGVIPFLKWPLLIENPISTPPSLPLSLRDKGRNRSVTVH